MQEQVLSASRGGLYRTITDRIVAAIEAGAPTYRMPWHSVGVPIALPANARTGRPYRGINVLSLWVVATASRYISGYWATYRQWQALGAQVRKGERGTTIVFYLVDRASAEEEPQEESHRRRFVERPSRVFNADQVDGWSGVELPAHDHTVRWDCVEDVLRATGADVRHGSHRACYHLKDDYIEMPRPEAFVAGYAMSAAESYYATLLHELTHWTAHPNRLDRNLQSRFGSEAYAMEELIAEFGAAFLCGSLGISNEPRIDHASYIVSWLAVLRRDARALVTAASKAAAAADYVLQCVKPSAASAG